MAGIKGRSGRKPKPVDFLERYCLANDRVACRLLKASAPNLTKFEDLRKFAPLDQDQLLLELKGLRQAAQDDIRRRPSEYELATVRRRIRIHWDVRKQGRRGRPRRNDAGLLAEMSVLVQRDGMTRQAAARRVAELAATRENISPRSLEERLCRG
jgi:hypothetical protein